jgi:hypothetical protein
VGSQGSKRYRSGFSGRCQSLDALACCQLRSDHQSASSAWGCRARRQRIYPYGERHGFCFGIKCRLEWEPQNDHVVSGSQLTAAITAADIAVAGTALVTVVNPAPGGGRSNPVSFSVTTTTPSVSLAGADYLNGSRSRLLLRPISMVTANSTWRSGTLTAPP